MTRFAPDPDYHNQERAMRSFQQLEFKHFCARSKHSGRQGFCAGDYRGARHIGHNDGPPSGSAISPVTSKPNRS